MRIPLKAWYFRSIIDENSVRSRFSEFEIESNDPLVIKIGETYRVMITSFGAVVFWPFDEGTARLVAARISDTLTDSYMVEEVEDRLIVETEKDEEKILYNEIWLKGNDVRTKMRIVAMLLAQSVALDHLEREADVALEAFTPSLVDLRKHGRIRLSGRKVLKNIGFAMETRHLVLTNLALFDKPSEAWNSEAIEKLYQGLYDFLDIPERQDVLEAKLDFIRDNTTIFFEVLSSRKSHNLEWIVIILIAAEIFGFTLYEMIR